MLENRRGWTSDEDKAILTLVRKYGTKNWAEISEKMSSKYGIQNRTGKQCRERWHNHLDPQVNKEAWTSKQQKVMFDAHQRYGNKWTEIAKLFHGRTDNDIKNHFYSMLRRSLRRVNKILGMRNSTKKIRIIKPSVLSKIFCSNGTEGAQKLQQRRFLAEALFQFSKSKSPLDLSTIIDSNERRRLQQLIQKLSVYNEQYEAGQLLKKDSKRSRDMDLQNQAEIKSILIINPKESYHQSIQKQQNDDKCQSDEGRPQKHNQKGYQESNAFKDIGPDCMANYKFKKQNCSQQSGKLRKRQELMNVNNMLVQGQDDFFDIRNTKNMKKKPQAIKEEIKSKTRGRPHKIAQQPTQTKEPQIGRYNVEAISKMQRKSSSNQQINMYAQSFDIPAIFQMPDLHIMQRRSSSYNEQRRSVSNHFLSNSTPTMDARLFTRTPKEPTPNMFLSKTIQNYEWRSNNQELDMIVNETREAINKRIK